MREFIFFFDGTNSCYYVGPKGNPDSLQTVQSLTGSGWEQLVCAAQMFALLTLKVLIICKLTNYHKACSKFGNLYAETVKYHVPYDQIHMKCVTICDFRKITRLESACWFSKWLIKRILKAFSCLTAIICIECMQQTCSLVLGMGISGGYVGMLFDDRVIIM